MKTLTIDLDNFKKSGASFEVYCIGQLIIEEFNYPISRAEASLSLNAHKPVI